MTADKLLETLNLIEQTDSDLSFQEHLEAVSTMLNNLTNSPAEPSYQSALAKELDALKTASDSIAERLSVAEMRAIASVGGADFFDLNIGDQVRDVVAKNAMTPSVARDYVKRLATARAAFLRTAESTAEGLVALGVTGYKLEAGKSDLGFSIPRELFSNQLGSFAVELRFLNLLLLDISEATLGKPEQPVLEALSTTVPYVAVFAHPQVMEALGKCVQFFLDAWKKIEEIRKVRADVARLGVAGAALEQFDETIEETVSEVIEESVKLTLHSYDTDAGRKNELQNGLSRDFRRLFGQIEIGLVVEFRAEPDRESEDKTSQSLVAVRDIGKALQYPVPAPQPLLLTSGEILEGEITRNIRKTTVTTRSSKKERKNSD